MGLQVPTTPTLFIKVQQTTNESFDSMRIPLGNSSEAGVSNVAANSENTMINSKEESKANLIEGFSIRGGEKNSLRCEDIILENEMEFHSPPRMQKIGTSNRSLSFV